MPNEQVESSRAHDDPHSYAECKAVVAMVGRADESMRLVTPAAT
jgi:hypothetical protein